MFATLGGTWILSSYFIYACAGYEVSTIIPYPTRVCGIMIVLFQVNSIFCKSSKSLFPALIFDF